ncbi:putative pilus assembly protein FilE [Acinetobacter baumannii]|uniref:FilE C-terminal domain-containing protein n=1 Tax=Acinetobacter baumannii TaxID=470 RepID=A0AAJ0QSJ4_ACIBA|nr:putative pilus assembly protein FilE [Acinetobacter baumannii]EHU1299746.1 putative pilus assembly protein FilE [Acinetobacter baumannii]EHU1786147.1 putative pilus assembly protein FilE [Acinetobacter baumannii]EHU2344692.1 putative pilus assembly protein FilE [Acinetobacter baumannii]EHU2757119.1 putative pilus assembly protein FilE [Acinetobacter baumannii]EKW1355961.1 putative pilus assembly protein FilE [Acinetobacter baumannii]
MVKQYKWMFRPKFAISALCIAIASISVSYADGFYTIIGPDGRPMIVPSKRIDQKKQPIPKIEERKPQTQQNQPIVDAVQKTSKEKEQIKNLPKKLEQHVQDKLNTAPTAPKHSLTHIKPNQGEIKEQTNIARVLKSQSSPSRIMSEEVKKVDSSSLSMPTTTQAGANSDSSVDKSKFITIDGVEYVNNEYLEDQEFNLEGKKRFYIMPNGLGRTESIERQKGVSKSTLEQLFHKQSQDDRAAIILAPTYIRLSQKELETTFEQDKCFVQGYKKSIKILGSKKEVNLWPRKPLKEKFEYELVKLDPSVQHLQLMSFAASSSTPLYYWPLAIFLDEKGCILEGASGFKSKSYPSTILQHASIQGTLKVPAHARYIMLTPLSSSIDVAEHELSNQGQIQISVLR